MHSSLLTHFDVLPPCIVRFLARHNGRRVTSQEIATKAKMSRLTVIRYSQMKSWKTIPVGVAERFSRACGHDLLRPRRNLQFLARFVKTGRGLSHLSKRELIQFSKVLSELQ